MHHNVREGNDWLEVVRQNISGLCSILFGGNYIYGSSTSQLLQWSLWLDEL